MSQAVVREDFAEAFIAAFDGDPRAAVAALLAENERLSRYIEGNVSHGYSRGGKAQAGRLIAWA
ncbi:hypothetical protein [Aureimonas psammosilenae]|uniref:hypothetical protein n=1 Tax=Aureimonas psammosilenae TaxID=2495496 RepID=UPI0012608FB9|nr:hypothetical protein [Aureimonas psammosilenae]